MPELNFASAQEVQLVKQIPILTTKCLHFCTVQYQKTPPFSNFLLFLDDQFTHKHWHTPWQNLITIQYKTKTKIKPPRTMSCFVKSVFLNLLQRVLYLIYLISILLLFIILAPFVNNPVYISPSHVFLSPFFVSYLYDDRHILISMSIMFHIPPCINLFVLFVHKKTHTQLLFSTYP